MPNGPEESVLNFQMCSWRLLEPAFLVFVLAMCCEWKQPPVLPKEEFTEGRNQVILRYWSAALTEGEASYAFPNYRTLIKLTTIWAHFPLQMTIFGWHSPSLYPTQNHHKGEGWRGTGCHIGHAGPQAKQLLRALRWSCRNHTDKFVTCNATASGGFVFLKQVAWLQIPLIIFLFKGKNCFLFYSVLALQNTCPGWCQLSKALCTPCHLTSEKSYLLVCPLLVLSW